MAETGLAPLCEAPDPNPRIPSSPLPEGACDCHAHIFDSMSELDPNRVYTPPQSSLQSYRYMMTTLGLSRAVIVQPSVYGTDNRTTLQAVKDGGKSFRAVVVVNENVSVDDLFLLNEQGACGARANALFQSNVHLDNLTKLAESLAEVGWHLQLLVDVSNFHELEAFVHKLPVPIVFDHFGHLPTHRGIENPGFQALLRLLGDGKAWVKLSGSYRITSQLRAPFEDVEPFAKELISTNPDQLVWASDWPHPHISTPMPNDCDLLEMLRKWAPDEATQRKILVDNPTRLYGFQPPEKLA